MLSESSLIRQQLTAVDAPKLKEGVAMVSLETVPPDWGHTRLFLAHCPDGIPSLAEGFDQHTVQFPNAVCLFFL